MLSGRRREQTHHSQKGRAIWTTPRRIACPWVDVFVVSRCRCWWANAGAGTRGDAGWSLSPERRCYGLWLFFSDLLFSSIFYTCDLSKDGRMNSPHSSETCWGTCWPPPRCRRASRWWQGFHLLCGTGTLTEAGRSNYTHWHTHKSNPSMHLILYRLFLLLDNAE